MQEILRKACGNIYIPEGFASGVFYIVNGFRGDIYESVGGGFDLLVLSMINNGAAF